MTRDLRKLSLQALLPVSSHQSLPLREVQPNARQAGIRLDKLRINEISKVDDVISIMMNTKLSKNAEGVKNAVIVIIFNKGVSESQAVNSLFSYLSRYVR